MDNMTPGSPGLTDLLPGALVLLAENLDLLGTISQIVKGYLLLDATTTLQVRGYTLPRVNFSLTRLIYLDSCPRLA